MHLHSGGFGSVLEQDQQHPPSNGDHAGPRSPRPTETTPDHDHHAGPRSWEEESVLFRAMQRLLHFRQMVRQFLGPHAPVFAITDLHRFANLSQVLLCLEAIQAHFTSEFLANDRGDGGGVLALRQSTSNQRQSASCAEEIANPSARREAWLADSLNFRFVVNGAGGGGRRGGRGGEQFSSQGSGSLEEGGRGSFSSSCFGAGGSATAGQEEQELERPPSVRTSAMVVLVNGKTVKKREVFLVLTNGVLRFFDSEKEYAKWKAYSRNLEHLLGMVAPNPSSSETRKGPPRGADTTTTSSQCFLGGAGGSVLSASGTVGCSSGGRTARPGRSSVQRTFLKKGSSRGLGLTTSAGASLFGRSGTNVGTILGEPPGSSADCGGPPYNQTSGMSRIDLSQSHGPLSKPDLIAALSQNVSRPSGHGLAVSNADLLIAEEEAGPLDEICLDQTVVVVEPPRTSTSNSSSEGSSTKSAVLLRLLFREGALEGMAGWSSSSSAAGSASDGASVPAPKKKKRGLFSRLFGRRKSKHGDPNSSEDPAPALILQWCSVAKSVYEEQLFAKTTFATVPT